MALPPMKVELTAYGVVEKTVKALSTTSGRVYVPASWIGKKVRIFLLEEPLKEEEEDE